MHETCVDGACACVAPAAICGGQCKNLQQDVTNCGSCGNACTKPLVCSQGSCVGSCAAGLTECARSCVDTQSNIKHCGQCYRACAMGEQCIAGKCG
jgi:hypothetical protein